MENKFFEIVRKSRSKSDVCRYLNIPINGTGMRKVDMMIKESGIDISHFRLGVLPKYETIEKICPVCTGVFKTLKNHKDEKITCSRACANTYFRSGANNGNYNNEAYRNICFQYHEKECVICKEKLILCVHHMDGNHKNNDPENLVPMCPTHHQYFHSRYRQMVEPQILEYLRKWKLKNIG